MDPRTKAEIFRIIKIFAIIFGIMGFIAFLLYHEDKKWNTECALRGGHSYNNTHICVNDDNPNAKYIIEW